MLGWTFSIGWGRIFPRHRSTVKIITYNKLNLKAGNFDSSAFKFTASTVVKKRFK